MTTTWIERTSMRVSPYRTQRIVPIQFEDIRTLVVLGTTKPASPLWTYTISAANLLAWTNNGATVKTYNPGMHFMIAGKNTSTTTSFSVNYAIHRSGGPAPIASGVTGSQPPDQFYTLQCYPSLQTPLVAGDTFEYYAWSVAGGSNLNADFTALCAIPSRWHPHDQRFICRDVKYDVLQTTWVNGSAAASAGAFWLSLNSELHTSESATATNRTISIQAGATQYGMWQLASGDLNPDAYVSYNHATIRSRWRPELYIDNYRYRELGDPMEI